MNKETSLLVALATLLICATTALAVSSVVGGLAAFLSIPVVLVVIGMFLHD